MLNFDRSLVYQFGFMFGAAPTEPLPPQIGQTLPEIVSREVRGGPPLAIRLRDLKQEQAFHLQDNAVVQLPTATWTGPSLWKLTLSPLRLDLSVDARGYADVASRELALSDVSTRIATNMAEAMRHLALPVKRFMLNVIGEASLAAPAQVVARRFFNQEVTAQVGTNAIPDLTARINVQANWPVGPSAEGGPVDVPVNRIEQASAAWNFTAGRVQKWLSWQFDVNTSPEVGERASFRPEKLPDFYTRAAEWIADRMRHLVEA